MPAPDDDPSGAEELPNVLDGEIDPLLEQAVQLYLELRLVKRPPEGEAGARRKAMKWLEDQVAERGKRLDPGWEDWLKHGFLDAEGDVAEATARKRHSRRSAPRTT
jgi:hypothetical protein